MSLTSVNNIHSSDWSFGGCYLNLKVSHALQLPNWLGKQTHQSAVSHPNFPNQRREKKLFQAGIWKPDVKVMVQADGETGETVTQGWAFSFS